MCTVKISTPHGYAYPHSLSSVLGPTELLSAARSAALPWMLEEPNATSHVLFRSDPSFVTRHLLPSTMSVNVSVVGLAEAAASRPTVAAIAKVFVFMVNALETEAKVRGANSKKPPTSAEAIRALSSILNEFVHKSLIVFVADHRGRWRRRRQAG